MSRKRKDKPGFKQDKKLIGMLAIVGAIIIALFVLSEMAV